MLKSEREAFVSGLDNSTGAVPDSRILKGVAAAVDSTGPEHVDQVIYAEFPSGVE